MLRMLCSTSSDFCINTCKEFDEASKYRYKKIAEHDDLMRLIYDYFAGQIEGDHSEEEVVSVIKDALLRL
jgi:hypothetical protein